MKKIKFITFDESRYVYSEKSKSYSFTKIYKVHSLTADERYCITEMLASNYSTFDPLNPSIEDGILSITYPSLETNRISSYIKSIIESPTFFIKPYFPSFYK